MTHGQEDTDDITTFHRIQSRMKECHYCHAPIQPNERRCSTCGHDLSVPPDASGMQLKPTVSDKIVRIGDGETSASRKGKEPQKGRPREDGETLRFRPVLRPTMALLCVFDDDGEEGEWQRIRASNFIFGRTEGDMVIPHDNGISKRHAEISRRVEEGRFRWYLKDLESTNGVFVRCEQGELKHNQELLIGSRQYRFNAAPQGAAALQESSGSSDEEKLTTPMRTVSARELANMVASLVDITGDEEREPYLLPGAEHWIGRDAKKCSVVIEGDRLVSPKHARVYRDEFQRWHIEDKQSLNGTWLRIKELPLDFNCEFQLGEQRFRVRFP